MPSIEQAVRSVMEDRRASYLFDTRTASEAVGCVPNKFGDWWRRNQQKLIALAVACPGALSVEVALIFAEAEAIRQKRRLP